MTKNMFEKLADHLKGFAEGGMGVLAREDGVTFDEMVKRCTDTALGMAYKVRNEMEADAAVTAIAFAMLLRATIRHLLEGKGKKFSEWVN